MGRRRQRGMSANQLVLLRVLKDGEMGAYQAHDQAMRRGVEISRSGAYKAFSRLIEAGYIEPVSMGRLDNQATVCRLSQDGASHLEAIRKALID